MFEEPMRLERRVYVCERLAGMVDLTERTTKRSEGKEEERSGAHEQNTWVAVGA